jgi:hypothetical protein
MTSADDDPPSSGALAPRKRGSGMMDLRSSSIGRLTPDAFGPVIFGFDGWSARKELCLKLAFTGRRPRLFSCTLAGRSAVGQIHFLQVTP